ncbi:MAG: hypothetical protein LAO08_14425 [Acidobacteriia bacterium]|nr:hypothetical protein [Terriglobia bacterium]
MRAGFQFPLAAVHNYHAENTVKDRNPLQEPQANVSAFYIIDKERKAVLSSGTGILTAEDLMGHQDRLLKDPDFDPTFSQLLDFTRITGLEVSSEDVRRLAQRNVFSPASRRAFVVQDDLQYGLARMFEIHRDIAGETGIRVFRTLDEAMNWIFSATPEDEPPVAV